MRCRRAGCSCERTASSGGGAAGGGASERGGGGDVGRGSGDWHAVRYAVRAAETGELLRRGHAG